MAGYSKEFLVDAFLSRFKFYKIETNDLRKLAEKHYDDVGKDKFRVSCALDAAAIKDFKNTGYCNI